MKFIDEAKISVRSGHGGPGAISFRREKFIPRGGPDGGDGGAGGSVIFSVNPQLSTLLDFKFRRRYEAGDGEPGARQNMTGANGANVVISVPRGTILKSPDGSVICDMDNENQEFVFLKGGRGGKGNQFFKTSVNQAPKFAQPGEDHQEAEVLMELKLIADVGIIGFPNAGKSTLISRISAARPKIADYPFTTLTPNLGVVQGKDFKSFVVADIPGLIKGAHQGAGLGAQFLRHIERTQFFIHLIDGSDFSGRDPIQDFDDINAELALYDDQKRDSENFLALSSRKQIVAINKSDILDEDQKDLLTQKFHEKRIDIMFISAATGAGVGRLVDKMMELLSGHEKEDEVQEIIEAKGKASGQAVIKTQTDKNNTGETQAIL